ncbi:MAG: cytochrome c peroxidase [Gammaproteobacteria bacterium]
MYARPLATLLILLALPAGAATDDSLAALGRALFFDTNLSARRTQSCASCHDPAHAFADPRDNGVGGAVSPGDDGVSRGTRNAPSIAYAAAVPAFARDATGTPRGGFFHDGRAQTLAAQAAEPLTNPREMALPDTAAVLARVRENPAYVSAFEEAFGAGVLDDAGRGMDAITRALAAFEHGAPFVAFDSRYDRFLAGELELTIEEELGRRLFFSDLTNCMACHLEEPGRVKQREAFTDHRYHNIGVPAHPLLRATEPDRGLAANPAVDDADAVGRFRTPTLRNVAVTAPYMHNGVFAHLATALAFYNQYVVRNDQVGINPETGQAWGERPYAHTIERDRLGQGQPLDATRIRHLTAFLRALTDRRYEHLLPAWETHDAPGHGAEEEEPRHE